MDQGQSDENARKIKLLQKQLIDKRSDIDRLKRDKKMRARELDRQCDSQVKSKEDDCIKLDREVEDLVRQSKSNS